MLVIPEPIYMSRPWAGERLRTVFGRSVPPGTGESWELSVHDHGVSRDAEGRALRERWPDLRLLFKLLDAGDNLSVQVHPAAGPEAKTEMWIVLDSAPGAALWAGLKHGVTKEELRRRIADRTLPDALVRYEAKPGDVFLLPGGTVHTLGAGLLIAEIQQPGDCTWRLYDWGRPRELHVEQGLADTDLSPHPVTARIPPGEGCTALPGCACFTAAHVCGTAFRGDTDGQHTALFLLTAGTVTTPDGEKTVPAGTTVFLPGDTGAFAVCGEAGGGSLRALLFRQPETGFAGV